MPGRTLIPVTGNQRLVHLVSNVGFAFARSLGARLGITETHDMILSQIEFTPKARLGVHGKTHWNTRILGVPQQKHTIFVGVSLDSP